MPPGTAYRVAVAGTFDALCAVGVTLCAVSLLLARSAYAADLAVAVHDGTAHGVGGIVVIAEPDHASHDHSAVHTAVMDQVHMQFVPNVLVIQTGSAVDFPNSDQIEHQVYSFSPAKTFELSLYAGHKYPPIVFDRPGLVTLGCNIHDLMIGYIYVTDSPFFGRTDDSGQLQLHGLPAGGYLLKLWHPGLHERSPLQRHITLSTDQRASEQFQLAHPLHKDMGGDMGSMRWAQD